jgi:type IX secretion system PorP/SprF family membrane protein
MKKLYLILVSIASAASLQAQDIPLFTQKMTNSFMYNPAVAGHSSGSLTYSFRKSFAGRQNAPKTNFLSFHTPFAGHRAGFGVNVYQEDVNFLKNTYASAAFAYHIQLNQANVLSFGVSGEYNMMRLSGVSNSDTEDPDYLKLANGQLDDMDFSFGMLYHSRFLKVGLAANRLATAWLKADDQFILTNYYTGFVQGMIPLRGGEDMLEPIITYRQFSENSQQVDIGLYYTYNDMIFVGGAYRTGPTASLTGGFRVSNKLQLGYTHEVFLGDVRSQVGATSEITLRYDFSFYSYKTNFQADYRNSMTYRKKVSGSSPAPRSPGQLHSQQKKYSKNSPNKRYQKSTPNRHRSSAKYKKSYNKRRR